jgi:hypothetical protein
MIVGLALGTTSEVVGIAIHDVFVTSAVLVQVIRQLTFLAYVVLLLVAKSDIGETRFRITA